jgi:NAD-dependent dihydropyrimidine dehydrogenase PreA subunit
MAFVITQSCVGVCDTACVNVCPCDCIVGPVPLDELRRYDEAERRRRFPGIQMFIDPDECVDCGACVPECPVDAIRAGDELPPDDADTARNARFFRL